MTTPPNPDNVLERLHHNRALWRLRAQLDASTVPELVADLSRTLGMPAEVARRVVESELQVSPEPVDDDEAARRSTRLDVPAIS